jgi:hypothetical protein
MNKAGTITEQVFPTAAMLNACSRFESAWAAGRPQDIEDFLPASHAAEAAGQRSALLAALVWIDLEFRWRLAPGTDTPLPPVTIQGDISHLALGWRPKLEDYLFRFPELAENQSFPQLIVREYWVRWVWGNVPDRDEYFVRFPQHRDVLRDRLARLTKEMPLALWADCNSGLATDSLSAEDCETDALPGR